MYAFGFFPPFEPGSFLFPRTWLCPCCPHRERTRCQQRAYSTANESWRRCCNEILKTLPLSQLQRRSPHAMERHSQHWDPPRCPWGRPRHRARGLLLPGVHSLPSKRCKQPPFLQLGLGGWGGEGKELLPSALQRHQASPGSPPTRSTVSVIMLKEGSRPPFSPICTLLRDNKVFLRVFLRGWGQQGAFVFYSG